MLHNPQGMIFFKHEKSSLHKLNFGGPKDLYESNGHHLGTIDPRHARWHQAEDREHAMNEAWGQSDLSDVLLQHRAGFDFVHTFSKFVKFVRSDEPVKNVIDAMTSKDHHCLVAVLEPLENDVIGICRPIGKYSAHMVANILIPAADLTSLLQIFLQAYLRVKAVFRERL